MSTTENYEKIAGNLKIETRPFINGKYVDPIDGQSFEKINPATGEIIANVSKCNDKDFQLFFHSFQLSTCLLLHFFLLYVL